MERYKINRIGLLNYWLYDEEEFYFYDGKLLLRGTNGSGKSVTMVSFFPLLFDGNKNPERFDTFGSRDRKVEDYVLPNEFDGNENTSYLYIEFYNKSIDKYLTIGIGLRAIRNKHVDFYGFAITDNRRIKQDFMLYKDSLIKIPLTKRELQCEIGNGGEFVTSTKEYKSMVNRLLFGFENESLYTELINLMLQLRSPKLSKDYKPTKLVEILSSVLEPLSEHDIETMSESIENMNKYKEKISDLKEENKASASLINFFYDYSNLILYNKCENYLKHKKDLEDNIKEKENNNSALTTLNNKIANLNKESEEIALNLKEITYKIANMNAQDLNSLINEKISIEKYIKELQNKEHSKEETLESKKERQITLNNSIEKTNNEIYEVTKVKNNIISAMQDCSEYLYSDEVLFSLDEIKKDYTTFNFEHFLSRINKEKEKLKNLQKIALNIEELNNKKDLEEEKILKNSEKLKEICKEKKIITDYLLEEIANLKNKVSSYHTNKILLFNDTEINDINQIIETTDSSNLNKIDKIFLDRYKIETNNINREINHFNAEIVKEENNIQELENLKKNIANIFEEKLDPTETKEYLTKNNIQAKRLYEVIKFKNNISSETKKLIEKALKSLGILDSFLLKDSNISKKVSIKTLTSLKEEKDSIMEYFEITDNSYSSSAISILKSISKSDGNIRISKDGTYEMGLIKGQATTDYDLKYIGEDIRKEYQDFQIKEYDNQIKICQNKINNLQAKIKSTEGGLEILEKEYNNNLNFDKYNSYLENLKTWDLKLDIINTENVEKEEVINNIKKEIKRYQEELDNDKKYYKGPLSSKGLAEVINNFQDFRDLTLELKNNLKEYQNKLDLELNFKNNLEEVESLIDDIISELNSISFEIKDYTNKLKQLETIINSDKYKNLKTELETLKQQEETLTKAKEDNLVAITTSQKDLQIIEEKQSEIIRVIEEKKIIVNVLESIFKEELSLGYSSYQEECTEPNKWFKNFKLEKIISIKEAYEKLMDAISKYIPKLQNYAGRKINILTPKEDVSLEYTKDSDLISKINELYTESVRSDLEFRYSGKTLNLIELNKALESELVQTESLLNEEDRKLFEDLLMNNIGESIRKKIESSNEWIKEVKNLMESMNTSSGLSFSIKWKGKEKTSEDELDTSAIVNILMRDPNSLKEEDLQKVTNHFRSKITLEEEKYDETERNYFEIIKTVLDYRKWFQFTLEFKRANGLKKELTDKEFSRFSGGEKAIAMYIPLFAGIYAKFNAAKSDAPRVIALDEAFAGVDDDNILDCFRILESMDIDYVMTSQILWGDYNTINHLAISELHHLPQTNVVSVLKYKWDGKKRSLVTDNKEYQE